MEDDRRSGGSPEVRKRKRDFEDERVPERGTGGRVAFYRRSMGALAIIFLVAGFLFLLVPDKTVSMINWFARSPGAVTKAPVVSALDRDVMWDTLYPEQPRTMLEMSVLGPHRLWVVLAFSMMMMITLICLMNWINPYKYHGWVPILLFSKACSSITGMVVYQVSPFHYLADLTIFITDFPMFLFILVVYLLSRSALREGAAT